ATQRGIQRSYQALGVLPGSLEGLPAPLDQPLTSIFFGRPAVNLDCRRALSDRTPGLSAAEMEELIWGAGDGGEQGKSFRRQDVVALSKVVANGIARPMRLERRRASSTAWCQRA